jgi:hypothetical protein
VYDRIGLPALNEDVGRRDADSWNELGGTGGWGNEDIMYVRPCRMCGRKEFSNKKAKSTTTDKKNDRTYFKVSVFGATNVKSALANAFFASYDGISNTKGALF